MTHGILDLGVDVEHLNEHLNIEGILAALDAVEGRTWSPWAILLVCFEDDPQELPALDHYEQLFTPTGSGTLNMVEFFHDMSHGKLDLSGTKVFGWYRLGVDRANYVGNVYPQPAGKLNRDGLLDLAKAAATSAHVNLSDFAGVCVSSYGGVDLCGWVGGMAALCDSNSLQPSLLGQEMGHGYGLDHARREGSTDDYQDPWDVMSTAAWPSMEADNPDYVKVGPGLNAWNMRGRGWLDESRVWTGDLGTSWDATIRLRPLHQHDLPGRFDREFHIVPEYLAAELGPYLVELRLPEKWDSAIPRACVLVHRFEDNRSYLETAVSGNQDLVEGDRFVVGSDFPYAPHYELEVQDIDEAHSRATVRLQYRPASRPPRGPAGRVLGGVDVDGGGVLIIGGRIIKVPPRGPAKEMVEQVARYLGTDLSSDVAAGTSVRRGALAAIVRAAAALHAEAEVVSEQPPGYTAKERG
jgi:hypothetical protein